uniref:Uncharacterized protein n=1 Tax=Percolomonas cosmopolitus TaxID=63605 RepID=A0A7S1KPT7_9EUKA|mmetsp:Transcript_381/g.1446  ORF Transcript_381/g.1446 Transcript_381/m.1446 type:complete len:486 (+) Transcript_381:256-1713(+)|eukprot:CAMPEP_0117447202 /NCGR_PEP_ID=MMETSP0759-20121206/6749_1 /TAXON_ID=63605 /ORGANISM="Percolomonas cosmopolitus, Strain WS" /LENGTH=485 /DNA_ID=CAMNT_0005239521 /DNA_START=205 /DNA_END=1662 /DNA_ORIENTATION=+
MSHFDPFIDDEDMMLDEDYIFSDEDRQHQVNEFIYPAESNADAFHYHFTDPHQQQTTVAPPHSQPGAGGMDSFAGLDTPLGTSPSSDPFGMLQNTSSYMNQNQGRTDFVDPLAHSGMDVDSENAFGAPQQLQHSGGVQSSFFSSEPQPIFSSGVGDMNDTLMESSQSIFGGSGFGQQQVFPSLHAQMMHQQQNMHAQQHFQQQQQQHTIHPSTSTMQHASSPLPQQQQNPSTEQAPQSPQQHQMPSISVIQSTTLGGRTFDVLCAAVGPSAKNRKGKNNLFTEDDTLFLPMIKKDKNIRFKIRLNPISALCQATSTRFIRESTFAHNPGVLYVQHFSMAYRSGKRKKWNTIPPEKWNVKEISSPGIERSANGATFVCFELNFPNSQREMGVTTNKNLYRFQFLLSFKPNDNSPVRLSSVYFIYKIDSNGKKQKAVVNQLSTTSVNNDSFVYEITDADNNLSTISFDELFHIHFSESLEQGIFNVA